MDYTTGMAPLHQIGASPSALRALLPRGMHWEDVACIDGNPVCPHECVLCFLDLTPETRVRHQLPEEIWQAKRQCMMQRA